MYIPGGVVALADVGHPITIFVHFATVVVYLPVKPSGDVSKMFAVA